MAFYKHDGSNVRAEWTKKRGFDKFGTRKRLADGTDGVFSEVPDIFREKYSEAVSQVLVDNFKGITKATIYGEFKGARSFSGVHHPKDVKDIILFDVAVHRKGMLDPGAFYKLFGHLHIAERLYIGNLNQELIDWVRNAPLEELEEGVVCKGGKGHKLWMVKIKTDAYKARLQQVYKDKWEMFWE